MTRTLGIGVIATMLNVTSAAAQVLAGSDARQLYQQLMAREVADRHLDSAVTVPALKLQSTPVKDILSAIGSATGLTVRYDQAGPELDTLLTVNLVKASLPDAVSTVLGPNHALTFAVLGPKSILVYTDTPANRQKYAETVRVFQIKNGDLARITQLLMQQPALSASDGIRPVIVTGSESRTITVRATADKMAEIEKFIAANDKG